jgi:hypothetical protein
MRDYKQLAAASGMEWSAGQAERQAAVLESLEAAFEVLKRRISHDVEPAPVFSPVMNREPGE